MKIVFEFWVQQYWYTNEFDALSFEHSHDHL